jgi:hypothetical protein
MQMLLGAVVSDACMRACPRACSDLGRMLDCTCGGAESHTRACRCNCAQWLVTRACVHVCVCVQTMHVCLFALVEAPRLTRVHADAFVRSRW